jgi:multidrug efflux pump
VVFKGEDEEQAKAQAFLSRAFLVALFIMAAILITQFNSFYSAFLILFAVVMSTVGVLMGLLITDSPFGIVMNGIGVIALAGIVVNNNIVLIDTHDRLRETLSDPLEAILRTGVQRLRPVLLTSVTTILGLMPMVLGVNIDFLTREITYGAPSTQWWRQLSTSIVFGLGFATVLTLLVTPSALMLKANIHNWRVKRHKRGTAGSELAPSGQA